MSVPNGGENYTLIRHIGSGGMGAVYEAWDSRLDRRVAVKFLHAHILADDASASRLEREARNAARIEHPNVVRVYRIELIDGHMAIEMQFIEGVSLRDLLSGDPLSPKLAAGLLYQILEALAACHAQGVVHCDLKPGNLLVTPGAQVFLTDFGISRSIRANAESQTGPLWGTPRYTPPEAWEGGKPTPGWDLYSAGAVVREALTGASLFDAPTPEVLIRQKLVERLVPMEEAVPSLSPALAALIESLMARDPAFRPTSARDALERLRNTREYLEAKGTEDLYSAFHAAIHVAELTTKFVPPRPPRWKWKSRLIRGGVAVGLGCMGAAVFFLLSSTAVNPNEEAAPKTPSVPVLGSEFMSIYNSFCFTYDDGVHGMELWYMDGYTGEVKMLEDIAPGPASSTPRNLLRFGPEDFLFAATTPETGEELWYASVSGDGVTSKIRQIQDIVPGSMGSQPRPAGAIGRSVLFFARTLAEGNELWFTNGRASQTAMLKDLAIGQGDSVPEQSRILVDDMGAYTIAHGGDDGGMRLWRYDLQSNALREIAKVHNDAVYMVRIGELLLFNNWDEAHGMEVWVHDPAQPGIRLFADLNPGAASSNPAEFALRNGVIYFQARTAEHGLELWRSDGTPEGTFEVKDLNEGPADSNPYKFIQAGTRVYFRAIHDAYGKELWMTDGTPDGTGLVADFWPGPQSGDPHNMVADMEMGRFYCSARDGAHGEEFWILDDKDPKGTVHMVMELRPGPGSAEPRSLTLADDYGVFSAKTESGESAMFRFIVTAPEPEFIPVTLARGGAPEGASPPVR